MTTKEQAGYCHIRKYLEATHKDLAHLVDEFCISLRPKPGHAGLTFIIPSSASMKELDAALYNTSDPTEGINNMLAHVVHDYLPGPDDWKRAKDDVPNGHMQRMNVKKTSAGGVTLSIAGADVEIVPDLKFRTWRQPTNLAVWVVSKGKIQYEKDLPAADMKHAKATGRKRGEVKGGHVAAPITSSSHYICHMLDKYAANVFHVAHGESQRIDNPMFEDLCSALTFLRTKHKEKYERIIPHMSPLPVSSFIQLFQFLGSDLYTEWYRTARFPVDQPVTTYHKLLREAAAALPAVDGKTGVSVADAPLDVTRTNFPTKIREFYSGLVSAYGYGCTAESLFNRHLAMFNEVANVMSFERKVLATRSSGHRVGDSETSFRNDLYDLYDTIVNPKTLYFDQSAITIDASCYSTVFGIFRHTDLFAYRLHDFKDGSSSVISLRPSDGETIRTLPAVAYRNLNAYDDSARDFSTMVPVLAGIPKEKFDELLKAVAALRS